jgi:hypothetical protein
MALSADIQTIPATETAVVPKIELLAQADEGASCCGGGCCG